LLIKIEIDETARHAEVRRELIEQTDRDRSGTPSPIAIGEGV